MTARAATGLVSLSVLAAGVAGTFAWRTAHPPLAAPLAAALAAGLGVPAAETSIGAATLIAPAGLRLERLRAPGLSAERIEVQLDPWQALRGHARPVRLTATDLSQRRAPWPSLFAHELAAELEGRRVVRAAFSGARVGDSGARLTELAGTITRDQEAWKLRAARPGLVVGGRIAGGELALEARLERLPLASLGDLGRRAGLSIERAQVSGRLDVSRAAGVPRLHARLTIDELTVEHPAVATRAIGPASLAIEGDAALVDGTLTLDALQVGLGAVHATVGGRVEAGGAFSLEATLDPIGCGELLRALPRDLVPTLDGLTVEGRFSARALVDGALASPGELRLGLDLSPACKVLDDPPLADPKALASGTPRLPKATTAEGQPRQVLLGPPSPSWRPLRSLPDRLLSVLVAAEDGRFFRHHGFDVENIGRALAADLGARRFERGASTISQQVVKNLFLSQERSLARKLEEAVLVWRTEQVVTKRRILELYVNLVELGPGVYGLSEAAERYFGKEPEELSFDEACQLAALLPAPRRGMDSAWEKRYQALKARLPSERIAIPPPPDGSSPAPVRLTRR